jgi:hypothetical protein
MKTIKTLNPSSSTIATTIKRSTYSACLTLELETKNDIRTVGTELTKFVGNDLSRVTVLCLKHA